MPQVAGKGQGYHRNVWLSFVVQCLFNVAFGVTFGPLFDVYLFQIAEKGQGNILVGKVESVGGLVALALVIPVGIIVDRWDRVMLMQVSGVIGLLSSALGAAAIYYRSVPLWYATMILNGTYGELGNSVCYALFADSIVTDQRTKATSTMGIISNLAEAVGPMMTFLYMLWIGNSWSTSGLEIVLMFGMVIINPLSCVAMLFFVKAPYEQTGEEDDEDAQENSQYLSRKCAPMVPWLVAVSDLITCIGAGMTIKYCNLYWKNTWHMSPTGVLAIAAVQPLAIAIFIKLLESPSERFGRAQSSIACFLVGAGAFVVLAYVHNLPIALAFYFIRAGMANAVYPLNKSIMFDFTSSKQRGRWNAVETLSGSIWSGSAFIGGFLSDAHGYAFTFLITALIYVVASAVYAPLLCIVPREPSAASRPATPLLAAPISAVGKLQSPGPAHLAQQARLSSPQPRGNPYQVMPEDS